jgi:uncharacterized membrane protein
MNNKLRTYTFITITIAIIVITAIYVLVPAQTVTYPMDVKVKGPKSIGFNIDDDALHFGIVPPGSNARRTVLLENDAGIRFVRISTHGDMEDWVDLSENNFILQPNTNKSVDFTVKVPTGTEPGNYTGEAKINFYRR